MKPVASIYLLLAGLLQWPAWSAEVLRLEEAGAVVDVLVTIPKEGFSRQYVKEYATGFAAKYAGRPRFVRLMMFTDRAEAEEFGSWRLLEAHSYEEWFALRQAHPPFRGAVAQAVFSAKGASLRYRSDSGAVETEVLWGSDPTIIRKGDAAYEILLVRIGPVAPLFRNRPDGGRRITVYLRTTAALDPDACAEVVEQLSYLFDYRLLGVSIRNDALFVYGSDFPLTHPLYHVAIPPSLGVFLTTRSVGCSYWFNGLSCGWGLPNPNPE
jgi:hypothetical protein